jgi:serine/threonine protein kinase
MDTRDDEEYKTFIREVDAVVKLNATHENGSLKDDRDQSIIFFQDWYISKTFVCICMEYADGGTLAQEIKRKASRSPVEPYAERRIAWYALQVRIFFQYTNVSRDLFHTLTLYCCHLKSAG